MYCNDAGEGLSHCYRQHTQKFSKDQSKHRGLILCHQKHQFIFTLLLIFVKSGLLHQELTYFLTDHDRLTFAEILGF